MQHHVLEIGEAVVERTPVERLVDGEDGAARQQQRVAVGRRLGDALRPGHAAGAADILDDELLAEDLADARAEDARDGVDRPAGRIRHDKVDRACRPALRVRRPTAAAAMAAATSIRIMAFLPEFLGACCALLVSAPELSLHRNAG